MLKRLLQTRVAKWLEKRGVILTAGKGEDVYLLRVWLTPYTRWGSLGVHVFFRGDADPAPHDHPWPFATFPLNKSYVELVMNEDGVEVQNAVKRWRWHYRPATYKHRVRYPVESGLLWWWHLSAGESTRQLKGFNYDKHTWDGPPIVTFVWMGDKERSWGFWPIDYQTQHGTVRKFVPWREYNRQA